LLALVGCSKPDAEKVQEQIERDELTIVDRYRIANVSEVERVLNDYLAMADGYEAKGWAKYARPGWIETLRGLTEGRLAVFYDARGQPESYRTHMNLAIEHFRKAGRQGNYTNESIRHLIDHLDAKNIKPMWRKEIDEQKGATNASQPSIPTG